MKIYDAHIHIPGRKGEVFWEVSRPFRNMEELIKGLDRWGISRGVICSTVSTSAKTIEDFIRGNREVLQTLKDYPDRFWGACIVNPKFLKEALDELETCRNEFGFHKKLKMEENVRKPSCSIAPDTLSPLLYISPL